MEPTSPSQPTTPTETEPSSTPTAQANPAPPGVPPPETQESQIPGPSNATPAPSANTAVTPVDWWVYRLPSPSDSYDADDDYGLGANAGEVNDVGEVEEEPAQPETTRASNTATASRRSTARSTPRWTPGEECEVLATFIDLDPQIRARTGQQGRSWYPLVQRELMARDPAWRHDITALKAKFNRLKETWRRINDRIKRSGSGRATGLPPWFHLGDRLWASATPSPRRQTRTTTTGATATTPSHPDTADDAINAQTTTPTQSTLSPSVSLPSAAPGPPTTSRASPGLTAAATINGAVAPPPPPAPSPAPSANQTPDSPSPLPPNADTADTARRGTVSPLSPDTIQPSPASEPTNAELPSSATAGLSIRGRRLTWGARTSSDGGEGCSRNAWWQYPRKQDDAVTAKNGKPGKKGVGRKSAAKSKSMSTAEMVGDLRDHFDKKQDEKWEEFKALTREVFRGYADERRSRRRRSPQSTFSSEDEA
ncbi:unnamed protein product [Closterium sp. Naga37s-1]|nr:unnamed protein product [Closterium sp. Naga37s-1]